MNISLSSHVLNLDSGKPAADMQVTLSRIASDGSLQLLAEGCTDEDGRVSGWTVADAQGARLQVCFLTGLWFEAHGQTVFYPQVVVDFMPAEAGHYHIPLLVNRHGYSTYRGS